MIVRGRGIVCPLRVAPTPSLDNYSAISAKTLRESDRFGQGPHRRRRRQCKYLCCDPGCCLWPMATCWLCCGRSSLQEVQLLVARARAASWRMRVRAPGKKPYQRFPCLADRPLPRCAFSGTGDGSSGHSARVREFWRRAVPPDYFHSVGKRRSGSVGGSASVTLLMPLHGMERRSPCAPAQMFLS